MLKLKLADYSNALLSVYLVDGQYIRDNIFLDFTEGGSYLRYDFIPEGEIWLGGVHIIECEFILIHELAEISYAIANGLDIMNNEDEYDLAHEEANKVEQSVRDAPNTLDNILVNLLEHFQVVTEEEKILWKI